MFLLFVGAFLYELQSRTGTKSRGSGFGAQRPQPSVNHAHVRRNNETVIKSGIQRSLGELILPFPDSVGKDRMPLELLGSIASLSIHLMVVVHVCS
jgi:hypothetical protein